MRRKFTFGFANLVVAVSTLATLATIASVADAQGQPGGARSYPPGLSEALLIQQRADALELSVEVLAKLQALIDEAKPVRDKLAKESGEAATKLQKLLDEPLPDKETLLAASSEVGEMGKRLRDERLKLTLLVRGLLTEEQRAEYMGIRSRINSQRSGRR